MAKKTFDYRIYREMDNCPFPGNEWLGPYGNLRAAKRALKVEEELCNGEIYDHETLAKLYIVKTTYEAV